MQDRKKFLIWGCTLICIFCLGIMAGNFISKSDREQIYTEMQEDNQLSEQKEKPEDEGETELPVAEVEIPIDFAGLKEQNKDIYAWIHIAGTKVDYPIVQHPNDDTHYLNYTVEHRKGLPGSIYTETLNRKDFSDANTLIYGHNMRNGSMFGDLSLYKNSAYMQEHSEILIYTPEHIYTYRVFAAVTYDNRHILYAFDFGRQEGIQQFLDSLLSVRNMSTYIDKSVEVTTSDRFITLSTCTGNEKQRFLVGAVLIDEQ